MPRLHVAILKFNTYTLQNTTVAARTDHLRRCSKLAYGKMLHHADTDFAQEAIGLLVAPEYFYAQPTTGLGLTNHQMGGHRQMNEPTKRQVLTSIQQISTQAQKLILIPGSIAWSKSFQREGAVPYGQRKQAETGMDPFTAYVHYFSKASRRDKAKQALTHQTGQFFGGNANATQSNPWQPGHVVAKTNAQKRQAIDLPDTAIGQAKTMARNTAYMYLAGQLRLKYHKQTDFHEVLEPSGNVYIPGTKESTVTIDGVVYGLEICLDHAFGALRQTASQVPDVHIILSATVVASFANAHTKAGGYIVHASSSPQQTGIHHQGDMLWMGHYQPWFQNTDLDICTITV